ncbi:hypothetical protein BDP67DRAFT_496376 [Colletotrichum lupini]|nr:hypothetical protein BDP67DRAFT_496376 [Colletotrichum lupini]
MRFKSSGILPGPMDSRGSEQPGDLSPESRTDVVGRWWILFVTGHRPVTLSIPLFAHLLPKNGCDEYCLGGAEWSTTVPANRESDAIDHSQFFPGQVHAGSNYEKHAKRSVPLQIKHARTTAFFGPADERPEYLGGAARLLKQRDDRFLSTPSTSSPDPGFAAQADGCIVRQFLVFARTRRCYRNSSALFH